MTSDLTINDYVGLYNRELNDTEQVAGRRGVPTLSEGSCHPLERK